MNRRAMLIVLCGVTVMATLTAAKDRPQDWAGIRVSSPPVDTAACRSRGTIHAEVDTFWMQGTENLYNKLRKNAADLYSDTVVLVGAVTQVKLQNGTKLSADGEVFRCQPPDPGEPKGEPLAIELAAAERGILDAQKAGDKEALATAIADDAVFNLDGKEYTKTQFLNSVRVDQRIKDFEFREISARTDNDAGVIEGTMVTYVQVPSGAVALKSQFVDRFRKGEEKWRLVHAQVTSLK